MRLHFVFPALLILSGCSGIVDPTFMPAGYTYHHEYYKSPPGPEAPGIGYPYTSVANAAVVQQWSLVARQVVSDLEAEIGLGPQPVHVAMLPNQNAFNASFDYALREELRGRGYTLTPKKGGVVNLKPEAYMPEDVKIPVEVNAYNGDRDTLVIPEHRERAHEFHVTVAATRNGALIGQVENYFNLPAYGYVRGEGQDKRDKAPRTAPAAPCSNAPDVADPNAPEDILTPVQDMEVIEEPLDAQQ